MTGALAAGAAPMELHGSACEFPALRPTYLPWVVAGTPPPPPQAERLEGRASYFWSPRNVGRWRVVPPTAETPPLAPYVELGTDTDEGSGPGDLVATRVDGRPGYLYAAEGDLDRADATVVWATDEPRCNAIVLTFSAPRLSRAEGEAEIRRIAASLH